MTNIKPPHEHVFFKIINIIIIFYINTPKSTFYRGNDGSLGIHWIQLDFRGGIFGPIPTGKQPNAAWGPCCHPGGFSPPLPVGWAPVSGRVPRKVLLHNVNIAFFIYAARQNLQNQPEPPIHGKQVRLDQDRGQAVSQQRLLHQGTQLVLLFGQQLQTQVSGLPDPEANEKKTHRFFYTSRFLLWPY